MYAHFTPSVYHTRRPLFERQHVCVAARRTMPPKAKQAKKAAPIHKVEIELSGDDKDARNLEFTTEIIRAWETVQAHAVFDGIASQLPTGIKNGQGT